MTGRSRGRGLASTAILGLYALVLVLTPLLHHDLDCHFKTPTHCQACVANPMAAPAAVAWVVGSQLLPEAGEVAVAERRCAPKPLRVEIPGRAPPA
jgi:hypothetical protein